MKLYSRTFHLALSLSLLLSVAGGVRPARGNDGSGDEQKNDEREFPGKMKDRSTVEWIIAAPGLLVNIPLKIMFKGIGFTAGYIDESRLTDRVDNFLTSADGTKGVRPVYTSRGGGGLKFFNKDVLNEGSKLEISAAAGMRLRQHYQVAFKRLSISNEDLFASFHAGYQMQPDERFFGIGPATTPEDESNFAHEHTSVSAELGVRLRRQIELAVSAGFENNTILGGKLDDVKSTSDVFTGASLPGLDTEIRLVQAGLVLQFDSRKSPLNTVNGVEAIVSGAFSGQPDGDDYAFWKLSAVIKCFIHLFYNRALVLRVAGEATEPLSGKAVPFFSLSELGREDTIRGFSRGRFRDLDKILGSLEYHYPVWWRSERKVTSFLFVDAGQVANDMSRQLDWEDVQVSFGGGFSYANDEGESLRFLVGKSKEQYRFYLDLN